MIEDTQPIYRKRVLVEDKVQWLSPAELRQALRGSRKVPIAQAVVQVLTEALTEFSARGAHPASAANPGVMTFYNGAEYGLEEARERLIDLLEPETEEEMQARLGVQDAT